MENLDLNFETSQTILNKVNNGEASLCEVENTCSVYTVKINQELTLNNAITTEKKLIKAVAKITGLEKTAGLLYTQVCTWLKKINDQTLEVVLGIYTKRHTMCYDFSIY